MRNKVLLVILEDVKADTLMSIHTTDDSALDAVNAWSDAYPGVAWEHSCPDGAWTRYAPGLRARVIPREMEGPTLLSMWILPGSFVAVDLPNEKRSVRIVDSTAVESSDDGVISFHARLI